MTTTGTHSFNPSLGALAIYALGRCGIRRTEVQQQHLADAYTAANLVLADMANTQPRLWNITLTSVTLTTGQSTVTCASDVVLVTDCYLTVTASGSSEDRILFPVGRSEYASYPNKTMQQPPTVWWFNRTQPPVITLYPVPDADATYTLNYYAFTQDQDAAIAGAVQLDIPYRFLKAFTDALAVELALIYAPEKAAALALAAKASMDKADAQDREVVPLYIAPGLAGYWRL